MANETILEIKLKGISEARSGMDDLSLAINRQREEQKRLREEAKLLEKQISENEITEEEYTQAIKQNTTAQALAKANLSDLNKEHKQAARLVKAEAGSLDELRRKLNLAQTEYGKLDQSTEEGRKAAEKFRQEIQDLDQQVKEGEGGIGDFRRNVGNYPEVFDAAGGGVARFGQVLSGLQARLVALMANPIGATIAALAAIGTATKAWYDYNNEIRKTNSLLAGITGESGETLNTIRRQSEALQETLGVSTEETANAAKVLVQQFGISYEEAFQKMQTGILATNGANQEFLDSVKEYSTFFADAGFSVEEFNGIINAGFDLGIYSDKLPDALKEADISLREQTKATTEALKNAFGDEFTGDILNQINIGALSTKDALGLISLEAEKVGLTAEQAATLTADVFRGAGEDAGGAIKVFEAVAVGLDESARSLDEYGESLEKEIGRTVEMAEEMDEALMSPNFIQFQETISQIGHTLKVSLIDGFSFLLEGLRPIGEAFKSLGTALGLTSDSAVGFGDILEYVIKFALAPLRLIMEGVALGVKNLSRVVSAIKNVFKGAGIAVIRMANKFEPFRKAIEVVRKGVASFVDSFRKGFAAVRATLDGVTAYGEAVLNSLGNALDYIGQGKFKKAYNAIEGIGTAGERAFNRAYDAAMNSVEATTAVTESSTEVIEVIEEETDAVNDHSDATDDNTESRGRNTSAIDEQARAEEKRLNALNDLIEKEYERNLTEEQLLAKRLQDKLKELDLLKDETEMTETEIDARDALYAKYYADLEKLQDKAEKAEEDRHKRVMERIQEELDVRIKNSKQTSSIEILALETAHLNKMRLLKENGQLTEEQRIKDEKQLQLDILNIQRDAAQEQLDILQANVSRALFLGTKLPEGYQKAMAEFSNSIAQLDTEIQNITTSDDGQPESIAEKLGLSEEKIQKAQEAMQMLSQGLEVVSMSIEARQRDRINRVDQELAQGLINEEQATRKREQIQKQFARKQQAVDIGQALINTALGVTGAFTQKPFTPANFVMAGLVGAQGLAQVALIKKQKFSKGGVLSGPSHAQGGIPMFSQGGAVYGEAEGGEIVLTKGVLKNPALASMASAINVAGGGVSFFENGGILDPIQSATPTERAADIIASGMKQRQPVLVLEQLKEREQSVNVIESLRTIG